MSSGALLLFFETKAVAGAGAATGVSIVSDGLVEPTVVFEVVTFPLSVGVPVVLLALLTDASVPTSTVAVFGGLHPPRVTVVTVPKAIAPNSSVQAESSFFCMVASYGFKS